MTTGPRPISEILRNVLTEVSEPQTREQPVCIEDWAKWLKLQTRQDPQLEAMVVACAKWARRFKDFTSRHAYLRPSWLSLLGKTGTGKTHCANRMWGWCEPQFNWARFEFIQMPVYWPALVRDLRLGERHNELRELSEWPVLMVDDIGAERDTTGFASEQLNTLLGCRVGKWTIITSNLTISQLAEIDPRIADRIIREPGNEFVDVDTVSFALRQ